jgi:hypothetical protein
MAAGLQIQPQEVASMHTLRNAAITMALLAGIGTAQNYGHIQERERGVIDRTQNDLRAASDFERHNGKQIGRYDNAERQLSDFDRDLTRGHFDQGRLDHAIDSLKDVVDHNTLDPTNRDALMHDLADLRIMRDDHDRR